MNMNRRAFLKMTGASISAMVALDQVMAAGGTSRPNILFFYPDQHRFDWTSMNPELPDITPNLRRLAKRGVHFSNALSPSPVCAPSRACLASGKAYANCGVSGNGAPYPLDQTTFYSLLRKAGYHVLGCGKFDLDKPGKNWGVDGTHQREGKPSLLKAWGFSDGIDNAGKMDGVNAYRNLKRPEPYFAFLKRRSLVDSHIKNFKTLDHDYSGPSIMPDDAYCDNWIANNGLNLIRSVPMGKPWFIQVNFNGPHPPMDITKSMYEKWKDTTFPPPIAGKGTDLSAKRRNYGAMIHNIDRWLGIFQKELKKRGDLENTLIVYCSDHGEMLGDRGMGGKSKPFHASACVPLVIAGPAIRKNVVCDRPAETLDLAATFLDYAGIPIPEDMDSRSLRPFLEGRDDPARTYARSSLGNWSLVFDGRYKLIATRPKEKKSRRTKSASELTLYDLKTDPAETHNICDRHPDIVARLRPLLPPVAPYRNPVRVTR
ncbi:MAG: sulfatase-like hydrolase/transferase [Phycisphaerales bacterium]|nr:MAG: sulfatase-like hydrolase/transferase [Phycisphaerales bacterium]